MRSIALLIAGLFLGGPLRALDKEEIEAIAAKPHSRENLLPALKIFGDARAYDVEVVTEGPDGEKTASDTVRAREKVVEGRYVVSRANLPGLDGELVMVITFDEEAQVYRKWILLPDGNTGSMTGFSTTGSRAIVWQNDTETAGMLILALEQHDDEGVTWTERHLVDGKVVLRQTGVARKVAPAK